MKTAIHWFRRDLRLTDNTALNAAANAAGSVVPLYIVSNWEGTHQWVGANRQEFLCGCLRSLADDLKAIGGRLIIREGAAEVALKKLVADTGAEAIFYNRDPDPFGRAVEEKIGKLGIEVRAYKDVAMHERDEVLTGAGTPFRVYSPYGRAWAKLEKPEPGPRLQRMHTPARVGSLPLPALAHWKLRSEGAEIIAPGEAAARERLRRFFAAEGAAANYTIGRTELMGDTTSRFSQDLRWGLLSIREVYQRAVEFGQSGGKAKANAEKFCSELAWRDFCMQILFRYPHVLDREFNPATEGLRWRWAEDHREEFERWCEGMTGFPIVDAGMRQLMATGFMHNRLRMITAMFFTKDLRMHWRDGEAYFMRKLVDGEIANNNGGWQWSAGTGADAAPYFRIQNPWTQSARFDPKGQYIRRWVPELSGVEAALLHAPPDDGKPLVKGYPAPMVDHAKARDEVLAMFRERR